MKRTVKTGKTYEVKTLPVPALVPCYNSKMGGVDAADQKISYTKFNFRQVRAYMHIFFFMIFVYIHNAHLAYMKLTERRLTFRMFVVELSEQLRGTHRGMSLKARRACTKSPTDVDSVHGVAFRTNGMHMPVPAPLTGTTKERGRIQCKLCMIIRQNRIDRKLAVQGQYRSIIMCDTCKVGLCCGQGNKNCFKVYHTVQALKNLTSFQVVKD